MFYRKLRSKFLECYNTEFRRDKIWKFDYYLIQENNNKGD